LLKRLLDAQTVIVVSRRDYDVLLQWGSLAQKEIVPNGVDLDYWSIPPAAPEPHTLFFPAALNWPPNLTGAELLLDEILPRVRRHLPDVRLIIAGRLPPAPLVARCARDPAVTLLANPPDMRPLFARAALVLVPLPAASGTRLKILQALAAGRPVVSTPAGAVGLDLVPGRDVCIAELVEPFAAEVVRLLEDEPARAALAQSGRVAVQPFDWPRVLTALDVIYPSGEITTSFPAKEQPH
jgi:glycosyltransferase involved in cell wall biosynthesis